MRLLVLSDGQARKGKIFAFSVKLNEVTFAKNEFCNIIFYKQKFCTKTFFFNLEMKTGTFLKKRKLRFSSL